MQFNVLSKTKKIPSCDALVIANFEDEKNTGKDALLDQKTKSLIDEVISSSAFSSQLGETSVAFFGHEAQWREIVFLGLGRKPEYNSDKLRVAVAALASVLNKNQARTVILPLQTLSQKQKDLKHAAEIIVSALSLSHYQFLHYKKPDPKLKLSALEKITFIVNKETKRAAILKASEKAKILAGAVNYARDLANHPGNVMTPGTLADESKKLAKQYNLKCKIMDKAEIEKAGMRALLAVNQGSALPPKFIILEYTPRSGNKKIGPVVLIGKGITFDSGGISLKPGKSMDEMKFDMCGAAAVLGIMKAAAELKYPSNLVGLIPATENLPSGTASRPGDIVRAMSGKNIEIINTDAEGRMILADALAYAARFKPRAVIDLATLTGAAVVALGTDYAAAFSNNEKLMRQLQEASKQSGEKIWPMPLAPEYQDQIKSSVADIKNVGNEGQGAGTIVGALFLQEFVSFPWIHLDIAGTAWTTTDKPYRPKGATGYGVKLMMEFLD
ncbi:MAG: leucyl aminopeptidase [bacterium]|nr:leucyl aminopeptidase [bacterium]